MTSQGRRRVNRRAAIFATALLCSSPVFGGSYLDRAALLLSQASSDATYLRDRLYDKELAFVLHQIAQARVDVASRMHVPKEVVQAHPHLLLVLAHYERACAAAHEGEPRRYVVYIRRALDEERTLRGVLKQLGWELPSA